MDQVQSSRPKIVGIAVTMLYVTLGISYLIIFIQLLLTPTSLQRNNLLCNFLFISGASLLILLIFLPIIYKIGKGRNWARNTFLLLFIFNILDTAVQWFQLPPQVSLTVFLIIVMRVIEFIALLLLFQKPSSDWFILMKGVK